MRQRFEQRQHCILQRVITECHEAQLRLETTASRQLSKILAKQIRQDK
jgi:hypothetical protein